MSAEELPLPAGAALPASPQTALEEHTAGPSCASQASSGRGDWRERDDRQLARSADCARLFPGKVGQLSRIMTNVCEHVLCRKHRTDFRRLWLNFSHWLRMLSCKLA